MAIRHALMFRMVHLLTRLLAWVETPWVDPSDIYFSYRLLFKRQPEDSGWKFWARQAQQGLPRAELVRAFLASTEFRENFPATVPIRVDTGRYIIYVDPEDFYISQAIIHLKSYEQHVTAIVQQELRSDSTFLDIGANMGWFTLLAASIADRGRVIAIEPNYNNVQLLFRSIIENNFQNVLVYPFAASDRNTIFRLNNIHSNGFVAAYDADNSMGSYVRGVVLDEILKDEVRIDLVKMDIEGHEPIALRGMVQLIRRHRPLILSEFHPKALRDLAQQEPEEYIRDILALGYRIAAINLDGTTRDLAIAGEVINYWQERNRDVDKDKEAQIDLLLRPV